MFVRDGAPGDYRRGKEVSTGWKNWPEVVLRPNDSEFSIHYTTNEEGQQGFFNSSIEELKNWTVCSPGLVFCWELHLKTKRTNSEECREWYLLDWSEGRTRRKWWRKQEVFRVVKKSHDSTCRVVKGLGTFTWYFEKKMKAKESKFNQVCIVRQWHPLWILNLIFLNQTDYHITLLKKNLWKNC